MKKNLLVVFALSLAAAGCSSSDGSAQLTWSIMSGSAAGDCGDSSWSLTVVSESAGSPDITDIFHCSDHGATVSGLRPGTWTISVTMTDNVGDLSLTLQQTVNIPSGTVNIGNFLFTFGDFDMSWMFRKSGNFVPCSQISGGRTVRVTSTGGGRTFVDDFSCGDEGGVTGPVPAGTYSVSVDLLDSGGSKLNAVTPLITGLVAVDGQDTAVNNILFDF